MASKSEIERFCFLCDEIAARINQFASGWIFDDLVEKLAEASALIGVPSPVSISRTRSGGRECKIRINVHHVDASESGEICETGIIWAADIAIGESATDQFEYWNPRAIYWLERWKEWVGGPLFNNATDTPPDTTDLTFKEECVVQAIGDDALTGQEIARKTGFSYNSWFRQTLSNLVKRGYLAKGQSGRKYRVV